MNGRVILAVAVIIVGVVLGAINFFESNVEYMDFAGAEATQKKVQVKGEWVREMESSFDSEKAQFSFYLKDDNGKIVKVLLEGAKPNNFELATSVVAKGKYVTDHFHATEVLTKCPSKYEGDAETMKKTL